MSKKTSTHFRLLAIALSARGFGFAIIEGQDEIIECGCRAVEGDKNAQSLSKIEKLIEFYQSDVLVLENVGAAGSRRAPRIKTLSRQINEVAKMRKVDVKLIPAVQTRILLLRNPNATKQEMAEFLAQRFPDELASRMPPKRKPWESQDSRMDIFDAVALAVAFRIKW